MDNIDVDSILERLLDVRKSRLGTLVNLDETEIHFLCIKSREIFLSQDPLLDLEAPIKVHASSSPLARYDNNLATRFAATYTASTTIFCGCSITAATRPKLTTSSSATTWTAASNQ